MTRLGVGHKVDYDQARCRTQGRLWPARCRHKVDYGQLGVDTR